MNRVGVPAAPINDYEQVFTDAHLRERNIFWSSQRPRLGEVTQLGNPMRFSRSPLAHGPAGPSLGADTDRVLAEFAGSAETGDAGSDSADAGAGNVTEEVRP